MTQVSEAIPAPVPHLGSNWGLFGDIDRSKWTWEAPKSRPKDRNNSSSAVPAFLLELDNALSKEDIEHTAIRSQKRDVLERTPSLEEELQEFRLSVQGISRYHEIQKRLLPFQIIFKQNLTLGLVSAEMLNLALRAVTDELRAASGSSHRINELLLSFYMAIWEGVENCKVLRVRDFDGSVMNTLVSLLIYLPVTASMQSLAQRILLTLSEVQLLDMESTILALVEAWSKSWHRLLKPRKGSCQEELVAATESVSILHHRLRHAHRLVMAMEEGSNGEHDFLEARKAIHDAQNSLVHATESIIKVDEFISPLSRSVRILAGSLQKVPRDTLLRIISSCSEKIVTIPFQDQGLLLRFRYCWLSVVARIRNADDNVLIQAWQKMETHGVRLNKGRSSCLVLDHWISQGLIEEVTAVRNSFHCLGKVQNFASLLYVLDTHREKSMTKMRSLFLFLNQIGRFTMVYRILLRLKEYGLLVPLTQFRLYISIMTRYDIRLAIKLYRLHVSNIQKQSGYRRLKINEIPGFITALVNSPLRPLAIWDVLDIPFYQRYSRAKKNNTRKPLSQEKIDLIHLVALEFSLSSSHSSRVAIRHICNCLWHLRVHDVPITPQLSTAVGHAVVTREIVRQQWISQERLRYALLVISEAEGNQVAQKVDEIVYGWRQHLTQKQDQLQREENVLRVGPID